MLYRFWLMEYVFEEAISQATGRGFEVIKATNVGGGCINEATRLEGADGRAFFVKTNDRLLGNIFSAEAEALREIGRHGVIRVPRPIANGESGDTAYLILEYLDLRTCSGNAQRLLGTQLAAMHGVTHSSFGWRRDNAIGRTHQPNTTSTSWVDFYRERRLMFQFKLAAQKGLSFSNGDRLLEKLPLFFEAYEPVPSMLHGDLWGGNVSATADGKPVIYDPALYYGDRETDLAFTEVFGGFSPQFYEAYNESYPLDSGYETRKPLYNLYHILNHYNLFGGSYGAEADRMIDQLVCGV